MCPTTLVRPHRSRHAPRWRHLLAIVSVAGLVAAGCGDDDDGATGEATPQPEPTAVGAPTPEPSPTTAPDPTPTPEPTPEPTATPDPGSDPDEVLTQSCTNPEGFTISYPEGWFTNDGSVTTECSIFDPATFEVPDATDARIGAISAFVDRVAYSNVAPDADGERSLTVVDGHQAVRLAGEADGEGLYDAGTRFTRYLIDLSAGADDDPRTLFVDLVDVGLGGDGYESMVPIVDRMARSVQLDDGAGDDTVARFEGGGTPFTVSAASGEGTDGPEACLNVEPDGDARCFALPAADGIATSAVAGGAGEITIGVAGLEVFRIAAQLDGGEELAVLPAPLTNASGVGGWALPVPGETITGYRWFDIEGTELGSADAPDPAGDNAESDAEAVGPFVSDPVVSEDFPGTGSPAFLTDVRLGGHDGFDRATFVFDEGAAEIAHQVQFVDQVVPPSGQPVEVEGTTIIEVTMAPATGVDLSGAEPRVVYSGPQRLAASATDTVTEVIRVEDFESTLVWAIGVDGNAEFGVGVLDDPLRLVIDVRPA